MAEKELKTRILVNRHNIKHNRLHPEDPRPVFSIQMSSGSFYINDPFLKDSEGKIIGQFRYDPEHPLSCGATVWFECTSGVVSSGEQMDQKGNLK